MDFYEYAEKSKETMKRSDSREISLYHSVSGIVTEVKELQDAFTPEHKAEELGDICWFLALLYNYIPFSFGSGYIQPTANKEVLDHMMRKSINLLDSVKGHVQYGRKNTAEISAFAEFVSNCVRDYAHHMRIGIDEIFDINIKKLQKKRFKNGYSDSAAINRDTASEAEEFKLK